MGKARTLLPEVTEEAIQRLVGRIVEVHAPIRVVLFGSHARHDSRRDSDIDLFIETDSGVPARETRLAIRRLLDDEGYPLDVVVMSPQQVAEARGRIGSIMSYVDAEGRVVYERQ
jgi:predicted nucleotidyltransferase